MDQLVSELLKQRSVPVLEPLCQATQTLLEPIALSEFDRLEISLDENGSHFICQAVARFPDGKPYPAGPSYAARWTWAQRVPERINKHLEGAGRYILGATDFTAIVIHNVWPQDKIIFKTHEAEVLYTFLLTRFLGQTSASVMRANFKLNRLVPEMPKDWEEHADPTLALNDYQRVMVLSSIGQPAFAAFAEQGTGKTPFAVQLVCMEGKRTRAGDPRFGGKPRMMRVLVVCPKQVRSNWVNEFTRFCTRPGKVTALRGGFENRFRTITDAVRQEEDCEYSVVIASYSQVQTTYEALGMIPWDRIILDESHMIKSNGAKRSKYVRTLRDNAKRRTIMTGTPCPNSVMDLYSQLEFLGEGLSGFSSMEWYRSFHGIYKQQDSGIQKLVAIRNIPLLHERLARLAFIITKAEARLSLPDKVHDIYEVEMTRTQAEYYKRAQTQLKLEVEAALSAAEAKKMSVDQVLTMLLRLTQITSGFVKWDAVFEGAPAGLTLAELKKLNLKELTPARVEQIPGGNPKIQAMLDLLQEPGRDPKGKTIVWAVFREDLRAIGDALRAAGINFREYHGGVSDADREAAVRDFNEDPNVRVFIANPATAGAGLNLVGYDWQNGAEHKLDTYTDHEIFFSQNWSSTDRAQAEDRAHRRGTKSNVRITDLVVPGSIDEEIRKRVVEKRTMALEIQDIREVMARVLTAEVEAGDGDGEGEVQDIEGGQD